MFTVEQNGDRSPDVTQRPVREAAANPNISTEPGFVDAVMEVLVGGSSKPLTGVEAGRHERAIFMSALHYFRKDGAECYEACLPVAGMEGAPIERSVIKFDLHGSHALNNVAAEAWKHNKTLTVFDVHRMLFSEPFESRDKTILVSCRHPVLSLGVRDVFSPDGISLAEIMPRLAASNGNGREHNGFLHPDDVRNLLDGRGVLRAFERVLRNLEPGHADHHARELIGYQTARWGRTQYQAAFQLSLTIGDFRCYVFHDVATAQYTLALVHGDVESSDTIMMRMHSSCITSETEFACDCDCVHQLEGALKEIAESPAGMLFYLVQEGRGAGIVPKATDRACVQSCGEDFPGHEGPYAAQGLPVDHRAYTMVGDILHMFGIYPGGEGTKKLILLSNNATKLNSLRALGYEDIETQHIEFPPNPYNVTYLREKSQAAYHRLDNPGLKVISSAFAPEPPIPNQPIRLRDEPRFSFCASYRLPIRPSADDVVLDKAAFHALLKDAELLRTMTKRNLITRAEELQGARFRLHLDVDNVKRYKESLGDALVSDRLWHALTTPIWMRKDVYLDAVTNGAYIVLGYQRHSDAERPMVRIHFDSLRGRIPFLKSEHDRNRLAFKKSVQAIVDNGHGYLVIMPDDARGGGLGPQAINIMFQQLGISGSKQDAYHDLGVECDTWAQSAALRLLRHYIPDGKACVIYHSEKRLSESLWFSQALMNSGFNDVTYKFLFDPTPR